MWSNGATTASITVSPAATTNYSVSVTGGCSGTASTTLVVTNAITAAIVCQDVCGGSSATLVASGGGNYLWSDGSVTSAITVSPASPTSYTVIVGAGSSCADTADCTINVFPAPTVSAASDTTIETGGIVTLTATGSGTYLWSNGSTDAVISVSPTVTTQYAVTVTDANGCTATAYVTVTIDDPCSLSRAAQLFVPNAFSPNGDNENDVLQVYYGDFNCLESIRLTIYDRWGEKVFFVEGGLAPAKQILRWDGTYKGKPLPAATFVYYFNATLITGEVITKKGNISLMK
jgi:gliding motility-associated-like protein/prepilin-type processing-associated H-X9-DG protein